MKNKNVNIFISKSDLEANTFNFPNKSNILFVTGLSGSGKSHLANELAKKYSATIFQPEWLIHPKHIPMEFKAFFSNFQTKYPEIVPNMQNKWNGCKTEDENLLLKKYINLILQDFLQTADKSKIYIVEGLQLFTLIDFELIKEFPFIIKRTSSFKALKQRITRDIKNKKGFSQKFKFVFRALRQSKLYQFKHRKILNKFILKLTKTNS